MKTNRKLIGAAVGGGLLLLLASLGGGKKPVKRAVTKASSGSSRPPSFSGGEGHLEGVNPLLRGLVERVREMGGSFQVVDGLREVSEQTEAVKGGASLFKSDPNLAPHVTGNAVDIWAVPDRDSWPAYLELAKLFAKASEEAGLLVRWGGAWETLSTSEDPAKQSAEYSKWKRAKGETPLIDPGHFELRRGGLMA